MEQNDMNSIITSENYTKFSKKNDEYNYIIASTKARIKKDIIHLLNTIVNQVYSIPVMAGVQRANHLLFPKEFFSFTLPMHTVVLPWEAHYCDIVGISFLEQEEKGWDLISLLGKKDDSCLNYYAGYDEEYSFSDLNIEHYLSILSALIDLFSPYSSHSKLKKLVEYNQNVKTLSFQTRNKPL